MPPLPKRFPDRVEIASVREVLTPEYAEPVPSE